MATTRKPDYDVYPLLAAVVQGGFPELDEAGVTFAVQEALAPRDKAGEPKGRPLWFMEAPVDAKAVISKQRDRVEGVADVILTVDGDAWPTLPDDARAAAVEHAIASLAIVTDDDGDIQLDDCNRPRLKRRKPDFVAYGWVGPLSRHRRASVEFKAFDAMGERVTDILAGT